MDILIYFTVFMSAVAISVSIVTYIIVNNNMTWWTDTRAELRELKYRQDCIEETLENIIAED